ncbi:MAG: cation:proton antiporter [Anaerolineae bacterium]|nr:cation:proton antiporter [Anaerolineae bacterium]
MGHGLEQAAVDVLAIIGVIVLVGFFVGQVSRRFGIPQVVGYIVAGLILGPTILHIVPLDLVENLDFVSELALGMIGFEMGLHLHFKSLRRLGPSIVSIVILQALAPFALVALGVVALTGDLAVGLLLGVLATATAPAATMEVLEEYDSGGPMTTSLVAVVGIDDALALIVFSLVVPLVESSFTPLQAPGLLEVLKVPLVEIGGSMLVGILLGLPLALYISRYCDSEVSQVAVAVGVIFLSTGLSRTLGLSLILTAMTLGTVVSNLAPGGVECMSKTIGQAGPVFYIIFFALVGARFEVVEVLLGQATLVLALGYMVLRIVGKYGGAWLGARLSRTPAPVRNNIGLALLSQGGIAIGLALSIAHRFDAYGEAGAALGALVVTVLTATTFVMEILGPILVKVAITRAGELGQAEGSAS